MLRPPDVNHARTLGDTIRRVGLHALLHVAAVLATTQAMAQSLGPPSLDDNAWRFSITPYAFLPVRTTGTATVAGADANVDLDLGDVIDVLNGALAARAEAWRGNFGLVVEGYYVSIGGSGSVETPGPVGGRLGVDVDVEQVFIDLLAAYRVARGTYGAAGRRYAFDVQAGARFNSLRQDVTARLDLDISPGIGFQRGFGGTETWWEPVVGLRGVAELDENWTVGVHADFGGFGVNGDRLQWKVRLGADYRPGSWQQASFRLGWQFYGIDFSTTRSDGRFAYDVFQTGPFLAFTYQFQ